MKKITILQSSLRERSHTSIVCKEFEARCVKAGLDVKYVDLRNVELQFCDGRATEEYNKQLQELYKQFDESETVVFGMPVYQYSMSGVLKNILDICG
jgi:FMN reductase/FAD reductase [NAD(P)H]